MATPFSPDLMFWQRPWAKNLIWPERGRQTSPQAHINSPDSWGLPLPLDSPWAQKGTKNVKIFGIFIAGLPKAVYSCWPFQQAVPLFVDSVPLYRVPATLSAASDWLAGNLQASLQDPLPSKLSSRLPASQSEAAETVAGTLYRTLTKNMESATHLGTYRAHKGPH